MKLTFTVLLTLFMGFTLLETSHSMAVENEHTTDHFSSIDRHASDAHDCCYDEDSQHSEDDDCCDFCNMGCGCSGGGSVWVVKEYGVVQGKSNPSSSLIFRIDNLNLSSGFHSIWEPPKIG